jgi:hypothetical protein
MVFLKDRKRQVQHAFCLLGHVLGTGRDVAGMGTEHDWDRDASLVHVLRMPIPYCRNCTKNRPVDLNKGYVALIKVYGPVFGTVSRVRVWVRLSCTLYPYLVLRARTMYPYLDLCARTAYPYLVPCTRPRS